MTDNFVNPLHISYAWLYKTECWGRKFHAFSFNSHRNCKIFMTNFNFIFDTICVPYIFRKSIFGWNCDHDTPLCDTPLLEDTPLCDTPDKTYIFNYSNTYSSLTRVTKLKVTVNTADSTRREREGGALKLIHTLQLDFLFSDWLFSKYAECIENVYCTPQTAPRLHEVLLVCDPACERHIHWSIFFTE